MSWDQVPELPFQGFDQIWQNAGWVVFTSRNSEEKMIYAYACHRNSGQIVRITIRHDVDENWKRQIIEKLMEVKA